MSTLAIVTASILLVLSGLHVYWAARGVRISESVIPSVDGRPTFQPTTATTLLVALALFVAATIVFGATGALGGIAPGWFVRTGLGVLAGVFLLRAIGDFRLIGFTKRVRDTAFARMDTRVYAPLCAGLAIACGLLAWLGTP